MEPEGSLPHSQVPATCPYPEPQDQSGPRLSVWVLRNNIRFYGEELLASRPNPDWRTTSVGCPRLLIQYIRSPPPYRRPFLHPQPDNAPYRGGRDPLISYQ